MPTFEISLSDGRKFQVDAADQETAQADLMKHISQPAQAGGGIIDAAKQGAAGMLRGVGETGERYLGVGKALKDAGDKVAPANTADTTLYDDKGFHPSNAPKALAEASPSVAAAIAAARMMPGPIWAKLMAGGGVGLAQMMGNYAKEATEKRTGDASAPSNSQDLISGFTQAAPVAGLQAAPLGRFLPQPAVKLGVGGLVNSLGRTAVDAGAMGLGNAAAAGYDQGVNRGEALDPTQLIDAGAKGALVGGAFGAGRTVQDAKAAIKYRALAGEDPAHLAEVSARAKDKFSQGLSEYEAQRGIQSDVRTEMNAAAKELGSVKTLSEDSVNALARAKKGLALTDDDVTALAADTNNPNAVENLQRLSGVARVLKGVENTGEINDAKGTFTGGISSKMEHHIRSLVNPTGALAGAAVGAHIGDLATVTPAALATVGGGYLGARVLDWASGNRNPLSAFSKRFAADGTPGVLPSQIGTGAGVAALAQHAQQITGRPGPTGPQVPLTQPWSSPPQQPQAPAPQPPQTWQGPNPLALKMLQQQLKVPPQASSGKIVPNPEPQPWQGPSPIAMKMLAQQLKNPPQAPAEQAAPPAPAPEMPQINPVALAMLKRQFANPPQAPVEPAPAGPEMPQFDPVALRMLQQKLKAGQPLAPTAPAVAPPVPTKLTKTEKAGVKVETKPAPVEEPTVAPEAMNGHEDLTIPDFLRRSATPPAPTPELAVQAMAKLNGAPRYNPVPAGEHAHVDQLKMSAQDFADHVVAQQEPGFMRDAEAFRGAVKANVSWKQDAAAKLAKLFPKVEKSLTNGFYGELFSTDFRADVRALREHLKHVDPSKAKQVDEILSETHLGRVWKKRVGKHRGE